MKISSLSDLEKIANNIKKIASPGDSIFLYGEIGVGKTTFARKLINNYELENKIKKSEVLSPTFNIVFEYDMFFKYTDDMNKRFLSIKTTGRLKNYEF